VSILYVDTSVLAAITLEEPGFKKYLEKLQITKEAISSFFIEAEFLSLCYRESLDIAKVKDNLCLLSLVQPEGSLEREILAILQKGYLRGADLYHLAVALYLDPNCKELEFFTVDTQQKRVARKIGFKVF